jgi:hypothetical protein
MGVETILLIVIVTFAVGFVLDRLAMRRRRFDTEGQRRNCDCNFTNAPDQRVGQLVTTRLIPVRRAKSRPAVRIGGSGR